MTDQSTTTDNRISTNMQVDGGSRRSGLDEADRGWIGSIDPTQLTSIDAGRLRYLQSAATSQSDVSRIGALLRAAKAHQSEQNPPTAPDPAKVKANTQALQRGAMRRRIAELQRPTSQGGANLSPRQAEAQARSEFGQ